MIIECFSLLFFFWMCQRKVLPFCSDNQQSHFYCHLSPPPLSDTPCSSLHFFKKFKKNQELKCICGFCNSVWGPDFLWRMRPSTSYMAAQAMKKQSERSASSSINSRHWLWSNLMPWRSTKVLSGHLEQHWNVQIQFCWHGRTRNHIDFLISLFPLSEKILEEIHTSGFSVTQLKETVLSREMAEEFYKEHREKPFFSQLVEFMCRLVCPRAHTQRRGSSLHPWCRSKFYQHL